MGYAILSVSATRHQGADPVADLPSRIRTRSTGDNLAGDFQSQNFGSAHRRRVMSLTLQKIRPVEPGSGHTNQHFPFSGLGRVGFTGRQNVCFTKPGQYYGSHSFRIAAFDSGKVNEPLAGRRFLAHATLTHGPPT
jgi:hypothetical protein